jgi:hypothetical protein
MGLYPKQIKPYELGLPVGGPSSNVYFVDAANGSDSADGRSWEKPLATIAAAYAKCTTNQHDVVAVIGGASSNTLSAALTWSKSYTHLVGIGAPTRAGQRARIFQLSTLTGASPLITVSGSGCIFQNLYVFQGVNDNASLINVSVTGGRNYFENVHFAGAGHATNAVDGAASLKLDGAEENTFVKCTIGVDTIAAATGVTGLLLDGEAHRNVFEQCNFTLWGGHAGASFVEVADATGIDRYNIFRECLFLNTSATAFTSGIVAPAGMGAPRRIYLFNCAIDGAGDWDANDRGIILCNSGTITGGGNAGLFAASAAA